MDDKQILYALIAGALLVWGIYTWLKRRRDAMRLDGMKSAVHMLSMMCSHSYERQGEPLPAAVDAALKSLADALKRENASERVRAYEIAAGLLGKAMGEAAFARGFEDGQRWTDPHDGRVRVDLTAREIVNLAFMAHIGFKTMLWDETLTFNDEADAEQASEAIRRLERARPTDMQDASDPYAQATNRMTMVWERYRPIDPARQTT